MISGLSLVALMSAAACSGSDEPAADPTGSGSSTSSALPGDGVAGLWSMTLSSPDARATPALFGGVDIDLAGGFSDAPGADGGAIRFDFADGAAFGSAADADAFAPGAAPFAVAAYVRTDTVPLEGDYSPNIAQKGLFGSSGQWKMQLKATPQGTVAGCRFSGSELPKGTTVKDETHTALDDGEWHTVVCWREADEYGVSVDGQHSAEQGVVGLITPDLPMRIANKSATGGVEDQFQGTLDCLSYVEGSGARETAQAQVPC